MFTNLYRYFEKFVSDKLRRLLMVAIYIAIFVPKSDRSRYQNRLMDEDFMKLGYSKDTLNLMVALSNYMSPIKALRKSNFPSYMLPTYFPKLRYESTQLGKDIIYLDQLLISDTHHHPAIN